MKVSGKLSRGRGSAYRRQQRACSEPTLRSLQRYAEGRSFTQTPEPPPAAAPARAGPLLFVVQQHDARQPHYDLRLELDGVLRSWAVPKGPSLHPADRRLAIAVEDHPFDYAAFEGVIPSGQYGAGAVMVWDCGVYSPDEGQRCSFEDRDEAMERARAGLAAGKLSVLLCGEKLKGSFALVRTRTDEWLLLKHRDRFASTLAVCAQQHSVLSGCTLDEIAVADAAPAALPASRLTADGPHAPVPRRLAPMLAEAGAELRSDPKWRYEPKLDGYRVIAYLERGSVRLLSRRGLELAPCFPEIVTELASQPIRQMVLDGEIVALGAEGRPDFSALQKRVQPKTRAEATRPQRHAPVVLVCFDLLHFAGIDLRSAAYLDRRRYLAQCLLPSAHVQLIHSDQNAQQLYSAALASGFEGLVAKRADSSYQCGRRSPAWLKFKLTHTQEFVIGGYTAGKAARTALGALLLGYFHGRQLHYVGHVGAGLTDAMLAGLQTRLPSLQRARSPFHEPPPLHRPTTWLVPRLVAEVSFAAWTAAGLLRAPVFLRLREDVDATSVRAGRARARASSAQAACAQSAGARAARPQPAAQRPSMRRVRAARRRTPDSEIAAILQQLARPGQRLDLSLAQTRLPLTHLDRIYWPADEASGTPAVRKRDLIAYLAAVSPFMLPHLRDRPLTMIRMPEGIAGEQFFQKHWDQPLPPFVQTLPIYSGHRGERQEYLLGNNLPTLLWLAQHGTLEFHVWHSRIADDAEGAAFGHDYASSAVTLAASALNYPDYLVFDIDPYIYSGHEPPGAEPELNARGFAAGRQLALWLRTLLAQMSLEAFVKTSGKTGLHVFVPIARTVTFDVAREICESVGRHLLREHPQEITLEWAVQKRTGRIFIDYNMNVRGKTLNVAYSPRGVAGAPVSMPLTWKELEHAEPQHFTIATAMRRLEKGGDRWHDLATGKHDLARVLRA